jgi:hypothetical protein
MGPCGVLREELREDLLRIHRREEGTLHKRAWIHVVEASDTTPQVLTQREQGRQNQIR